METPSIPLDQILQGDCLDVLEQLPGKSVDLIFADPPYNLQLRGELWRPNLTRVAAVEEDWDRFSGFEEYDEFTRRWLGACRRVLKDTGTIWVIGTYHNIYRVGAILQELGFWVLNDVVWIKTNPMPNFRGVRFANAHETLIWASKSKGSRYCFDHHAMKSLNDELQMRSDWLLPICNGSERIKIDGKKAHPTQKPEALLYRVILSASQPGDVVLDPFFGTGTTGAVAKRLHRHWIGIELEEIYVQIAQKRLEAIRPDPYDPSIFEIKKTRRRCQVRFGSLLENGLLRPGQSLYFQGNRDQAARLRPDGQLVGEIGTGTIHMLGRQYSGGSPCNGWEHWFYETESGELQPIDVLRKRLDTSGSPEKE
jgi:site-specific DNA-methyltransferase (adenine-specific)